MSRRDVKGRVVVYLEAWSRLLSATKLLSNLVSGVNPSGLAGKYQRFGGTFCLHFHCVSPGWYLPTRSRGFKIENSNTKIFTVIRIPDKNTLTQKCRMCLKKIIVTQTVNKFPAIYRNLTFITMFITIHQ